MAENEKPQDTKKEKKSLGIVFTNESKAAPQSYDLKGTVTTPDGTKYRVGAYKSSASGDGKLKKDQPYWWFHRVEKLEINTAGDAFDPTSLE